MFTTLFGSPSGQSPWNTPQGGETPAPGASPWAASIEPAQNRPMGRNGSILNMATGGAPNPGTVMSLVNGGAPQPGSIFSGLTSLFGGGPASDPNAANLAAGGPGDPQRVQGGTPPGGGTGGGLLGGLSLGAGPGGGAANPPPSAAVPSPIEQGNPVGGHWNTGGFNFAPTGGAGGSLMGAPTMSVSGDPGLGSDWFRGYGGVSMNPFMRRQG